jgi:hypothetical protein
MSTSNFFSTENRHNERLIRILSVGSLVSKPPTKEKRISIKVRMPLSNGGVGTGIMGAPEFIEAGYMFVAKHGDTVTPDMEFKGYALEFSAENLFGEPILAGDSIMRGFEISEFGNEEAPDVVLSFTIRIPFSGNRWQWLGMFVGEDVWAKFTPGEAGTVRVETEQDGTLLDDGENDDDEDEGDEPDTLPDSGDGDDPELDKPEELEYESPDPRISLVAGGKSGPKDLAAFHDQELDKGTKTAVRRPRGFSRPLHQGNEEF